MFYRLKKACKIASFARNGGRLSRTLSHECSLHCGCSWLLLINLNRIFNSLGLFVVKRCVPSLILRCYDTYLRQHLILRSDSINSCQSSTRLTATGETCKCKDYKRRRKDRVHATVAKAISIHIHYRFPWTGIANIYDKQFRYFSIVLSESF